MLSYCSFSSPGGVPVTRNKLTYLWVIEERSMSIIFNYIKSKLQVAMTDKFGGKHAMVGFRCNSILRDGRPVKLVYMGKRKFVMGSEPTCVHLDQA